MRPDDLASLKVLIVDDNPNVQRLIGDVLRAGGVGFVDFAEDGQRARQMLARWDPDIIFCDWNMPVMSGLELTHSIRRAAVNPDRRVPNPEVPVVIVTAHRSQREVEEARKAGVNEFVIKPFTPAALLSRIELVLTKPRPFIVSEAYIGPDRRRRVELSYSGPLRRMSDPDEVVDTVERSATRETISVELEALRRLIQVRGGVDRDTLKMTYRVMQHTSFRARQVRDNMVDRASKLLMDYVEAMGGHDACDPKVLDIHFKAIGNLLDMGPEDAREAAKLVSHLAAVVKQKVARAQKAA
ncbi:response regulator [Phenylobacterium sp.]|jgi:CheY-like chemotaxis protein|uniref:response regulator n=1 Tax=Phenylobacterium sp. TaxID=1871053 RepID=UPI002F92557D